MPHGVSRELMQNHITLALQILRRDFPAGLFGCLVWCAPEGLDVCRHAWARCAPPGTRCHPDSPSGRMTRENGSFVYLPTTDTKFGASLELTKLAAKWRELVLKFDYAGARAFILESVRRMCNTLARQVEDREALALKKKARDVVAQAPKK